MGKKGKSRSYSLAAFAWQRLRRDKLAMTGIGIIIFTIIIAILGYLITPDSSPDADTHIDEIGLKHPGFKCKLIRFKKNAEPHHTNFLSEMIFGKPNDFEYHAFVSYYYEGDEIVWKELSDDTVVTHYEYDNQGKMMCGKNKSGDVIVKRKELDDAVYALNLTFPRTYDSINGYVDFYAYGETHKLHKSLSELRNEMKDNLEERRFYLGTAVVPPIRIKKRLQPAQRKTE